MVTFAKRVRRWIGQAADWLGFSTRRVLTTNPPPLRINKRWQKPMPTRPQNLALKKTMFDEGDEADTPVDNVPHQKNRRDRGEP